MSSLSGLLTLVCPPPPVFVDCASADATTGNNIGHPILNGVVPDPLKVAIAKILDASHKAGKKCGMYCATGEQAQASAAQGFDMINVATDYTSLEALVKVEMSVATSQAKPERGVSY